MQKLVRVGVGMLAALALAGVVVGIATAAPAGGRIQLFATVENGPTEKIVFAGAIGDWGHVQTVNKSGKPSENGHFEKVTLKNGTFFIDATALDKKMDSSGPQVASDVTCSVAMSATAPVKLFKGTGLYAGISGKANVTVTFTGIGPRYQSGVKKGQCNQNSQPLAALGSVIGHGSVHFN